jgi:hypothetical protein
LGMPVASYSLSSPCTFLAVHIINLCHFLVAVLSSFLMFR